MVKIILNKNKLQKKWDFNIQYLWYLFQVKQLNESNMKCLLCLCLQLLYVRNVLNAFNSVSDLHAYVFTPGSKSWQNGKQVTGCHFISAPDDKKKDSDLENELSDNEDEMTDSQKTNKLSEVYSTTIPSVDSAMESWDGSGIDAGFSSQGELDLVLIKIYLKIYICRHKTCKDGLKSHQILYWW